MKRVLFVGDLRPHSRSYQRLRAMRALGCDVTAVTTVPVDEPPPGGRGARLSDRVRHRLGVPRDGAGANAALLAALAEGEFELLWVEKALSLRSSTLRAACRRAPRMLFAFFSEDDMFRRDNGSRWFRDSLSLYDVVFTTKSFNAAPKELPALGARHVIYVPKSFDKALHRPVEVDADAVRRLGAPVGFVGTFEESRAESLAFLARELAPDGVPVRVWGNGWEAWRDRPDGLRIEGRAIYGDEYVRALCATDVNLGFLRRANRDLHTDRSVEIPACGALLLAERTSEHAELFEEGVEAELFADRDEMLVKVRRYVADPEARARIAAAGRERCLRSDYSHEAAVRRMLAALEAREGRRAA